MNCENFNSSKSFNAKKEKPTRDALKKEVLIKVCIMAHEASSDMSFEVTDYKLISSEIVDEDSLSNSILETPYLSTENSSISNDTNRTNKNFKVTDIKNLEVNNLPSNTKLNRISSLLDVIESSNKSELSIKIKNEKKVDREEEFISPSLETKQASSTLVITQSTNNSTTRSKFNVSKDQESLVKIKNKDDYDPDEHDDLNKTICSEEENITEEVSQIGDCKSRVQSSSTREKESYLIPNMPSLNEIRSDSNIAPGLKQQLHSNKSTVRSKFLEENKDTLSIFTLDLVNNYQASLGKQSSESVFDFQAEKKSEYKEENELKHEQSLLNTKNDDDSLVKFSNQKNLKSIEGSTLKLSSLEISSDSITEDIDDITNKNINIKMKVSKKNEERSALFCLLENETNKKFLCPEMPNIFINTFRRYSDDENTNIQIKVIEVDDLEDKESKKKLVGDFTMVLRPDQYEKEIEFLDEFKNKITIRLKKQSSI